MKHKINDKVHSVGENITSTRVLHVILYTICFLVNSSKIMMITLYVLLLLINTMNLHAHGRILKSIFSLELFI